MNFAGKNAFITGGASGLGLGIARALAAEGANVALADIQPDRLQLAVEEISRLGVRSFGIVLDVSNNAAVEKAASTIEAEFGNVDILVNNAGVAVTGLPVNDVTLEEWQWILGVNLYGVIYCIKHFMPMILRRPEGQIVNVASIGGLQVSPDNKTGAYAVSKYGVVALSESLQHDVQARGIAVSVVCPAAIRTEIASSGRLRPERFGGAYEPHSNEYVRQMLEESGIHPNEAGRRVVEGMRRREFFIFTHPECRGWIEARHQRLMAAFDSAEGLVS